MKTKAIIKDNEEHYIKIKISLQEAITLVIIYALNIGAPIYVKQPLTSIKGERDSNTLIVGDFYTSVTTMDRYFRPKIIKETAALNGTVDQMDLIDILRAFHPQSSRIYILLKWIWKIFQDRPHVRPQNKSQ